MTLSTWELLNSRGGGTTAASSLLGLSAGGGDWTVVLLLSSNESKAPAYQTLSASSYAFIVKSIAEHGRGESTLLSLDDLETDDE